MVVAMRKYPLWAWRMFALWFGLTVLCAIVLVVARPAHAARCPHGEILRVSMGRCVSIHSKLAQGYVRTLPRHKRIAVALPKAKPVPIEPPEIEVLRERLARNVAALDASAILLSRAAALTAEVR
jgi:hypothetical protein